MSAACAGMSPFWHASATNRWPRGYSSNALDDVLKQDGELEALSHSLSAIHQKLAAGGRLAMHHRR